MISIFPEDNHQLSYSSLVFHAMTDIHLATLGWVCRPCDGCVRVEGKTHQVVFPFKTRLGTAGIEEVKSSNLVFTVTN